MNTKKVLIISYLWPPAEGVGLIRALKFAKYLPLYGWQPLVLTAKVCGDTAGSGEIGVTDVKVYRTEYKDILKGIKNLFFMPCSDREEPSADKNLSPAAVKGRAVTYFARELITIPDEQIGWLKYAVGQGEKIVDEERVKLIFSTSPPETSHLIARRLKKYGGIPWIADLRDLWSDDHFRTRPLPKRAVLKIMEKHVLKDADLLVTVSKPWAQRLGASLGMVDRVEVIENGYDEEDFAGAAYEGNEKFTVVYAGKLHKEHQRIDIFLRALSGLIKSGRVEPGRIDVRFYALGYDRPNIRSLAASYGLNGVVKEFEKVDYQKSLHIQRASDILLFIQWQGRGSDGWYSAKLYDYIGARRPILALADGDGIVNDLISGTASGLVADSEAALKTAILKFYEEHGREGKIRYKGNEDQVSKHTRKLRAGELAALFDGLLET